MSGKFKVMFQFSSANSMFRFMWNQPEMKSPSELISCGIYQELHFLLRSHTDERFQCSSSTVTWVTNFITNFHFFSIRGDNSNLGPNIRLKTPNYLLILFFVFKQLVDQINQIQFNKYILGSRQHSVTIWAWMRA